MCLLIAMPSGPIKDIEALQNGYNSNSHGAGFVYAHDRQLTMKKGFFTFEEFLAEYEKIPEGAPAVVHFRLSTGGKTDENNCHPFMISKNLAFAHNGIFSFVTSCSNYSDTWHFNEEFMKPLFAKNNHGIFTEGGVYTIKQLIGSYNKLAFINHLGEIALVNGASGQMHEGAWFSNGSYMSYRRSNSYFSTRHNNSEVKALEDKGGNNSNTFSGWIRKIYDEFNEDSKALDSEESRLSEQALEI